MYCKHCGKAITEDSIYCKYCGGKQDTINTSEPLEAESVISTTEETPKESPSKISDKVLGWLIGYGVYVVINVLLLISGDSYSSSRDYFWPFGESNLMHHEPFNPTNYDITEFIVYVFLIPLLVFGWMKFKNKIMEEPTQNLEDTTPSEPMKWKKLDD